MRIAFLVWLMLLGGCVVDAPDPGESLDHPANPRAATAFLPSTAPSAATTPATTQPSQMHHHHGGEE